MNKPLAAMVSALAVVCCAGSAPAVEIKGKVVEVRDDTVKIAADSQDLLPNPGDKVEVYFEIPGLDDVAVAGSGKVAEADGEVIVAKLDRGAGKVAKDHLVKILCDNPRKKPPRGRESIVGWKVDFDAMPAGFLQPGALARQGIRSIESVGGRPAVFKTRREWVVPEGRKQVLLDMSPMAGGRLILKFNQPIHGFSLTRPGAGGNYSYAPWRLQAMDGQRVVDSVGEDQRVTDPKPKTFSVKGANITQVELVTDNRGVKTPIATSSSLPIVEFSLTRIEIEPPTPRAP